nr:hypothetical protein Iba_chr09dCG14620 [Ipomoea batatas]
MGLQARRNGGGNGILQRGKEMREGRGRSQILLIATNTIQLASTAITFSDRNELAKENKTLKPYRIKIFSQYPSAWRSLLHFSNQARQSSSRIRCLKSTNKISSRRASASDIFDSGSVADSSFKSG